VTEAQMAEIKEYVSKLREKYNLSEKEVQDVTLALASHPGQSLKAEMEMLNRILATTDSFSDPASRTQAGHVLLQSYSQLTPARAFKPEHFPQGVVEALTRFGFEKGPGLGYKWGGEERLTEVARIIAVMDEKAFKILLPVMGTWEPKSGKAFEFIAEYPDSLPGVGDYTPESAASTIVSEVRR
jgi:hypothetical protein